ncbi:uncharacterized protein [Clytia hemisphaerica]|uniref:uncharacterized protein n=1 Tax=Clytia hemisphaerica TaxID=252671 RepID=UPI0034D7B349
MTAYKSVASESMEKAGKEVLSDAEKTEEGKGLCHVSLDGSWQRRGHASLNGLVTTISKGKCIDVEVISSAMEGAVTPNKQECVVHIQKRLGTRLCKQVKELSGKGKLTDTMINSMQNYYGMAIRRNIGNLYTMKKAIQHDFL